MYLTSNFVKHRISKLVGIMALLIISVCFSNAQSKDIKNPTTLNSNEISGTIGDNVGETYFYSFYVNPGELKITTTLEAKGKDSYCQVSYEVFNDNAVSIGSGSSIAHTYIGAGQNQKQAIGKINFSRKQKILFKMTVNNFPCSGKYSFQFSGSFESKSEEIPDTGNSVEIANSLKKERGNFIEFKNVVLKDTMKTLRIGKDGVLIIKMKDGTKKIIEISQIEDMEYIEP